MGMKFWHELSRGEQKEKLRNYGRENFLRNIKWKPVVCLVTYVKFRVLGPSVQTEHYTLKGRGELILLILFQFTTTRHLGWDTVLDIVSSIISKFRHSGLCCSRSIYIFFGQSSTWLIPDNGRWKCQIICTRLDVCHRECQVTAMSG